VTTVILARHGETDWNRRGIWQGHGDPPLNAEGRRQATELARRLVAEQPVTAVYSSDLRRARETAELVASGLGLPVQLDPGLREMDVGSWTGLTIAEIQERFGTDEHDGEKREDFDARAVAAMHRVAATHEHAIIVVVSHGGVARALQRHVLGDALPLLGNGEAEWYRYEDGRFTRVGNDT
jgi:broad specificity phosphatase PhoE